MSVSGLGIVPPNSLDISASGLGQGCLGRAGFRVKGSPHELKRSWSSTRVLLRPQCGTFTATAPSTWLPTKGHALTPAVSTYGEFYFFNSRNVETMKTGQGKGIINETAPPETVARFAKAAAGAVGSPWTAET